MCQNYKETLLAILEELVENERIRIANHTNIYTISKQYGCDINVIHEDDWCCNYEQADSIIFVKISDEEKDETYNCKIDCRETAYTSEQKTLILLALFKHTIDYTPYETKYHQLLTTSDKCFLSMMLLSTLFFNDSTHIKIIVKNSNDS